MKISFSKLSVLFTYLLLSVICGEDFYKILEINRDTKDNEIKKAFRRLSLKYHPDKNKG
jgi:preprotein translocase subunit Sec63